ncbi:MULTISPECIES: HNH endonuclease [unclassified Paenibacillus]|uniref:HNH endonuclease n=1 Tax=unclassified Paenibacillus TaxID=185978 RepID=UPI003832DA18
MSVLQNGIGYESLHFYGSFQPQHIEKLQITRAINDHAYLMVSGMLSEEKGAACIGQNMEDEPIVIRQLDEQGQSLRRLFHGIVTRLSVHCTRGVYTFELEAASHSYQMDIKLKKRSHQDIHRTYDDLVTAMVRKYQYGDAIDTVTNYAKLDTFVLQYEETDWAFLKRLASRFGSVLVPEVTAASPKVFFGMPEGKTYKVERDVFYRVRKTFHELDEGKPGKRAGSYVTYVIESLLYVALGDLITLPIGSGKELVVVRAVTQLEDGLLLTRYDLQAEQDIRYARYENDQATGITLTGSVLKVQQDFVQLQLDIDPKQDPAKACWFPVATRYVAEEHSGWYDMPEIGERVELYLPTSREHKAYVTDSLRQQRHATGQPDVKVWRHAQGSGVDMSEQELTLSTSGAFSITLHEGSGITVSSPGNVQIQGGHVKLDAGQELSLEAGSALYLKGGDSSMVLDGETDIKAPVIDQEGTVKAPVFVMDLPPVPEPPLMNIKAYEAAQSEAAKATSNSTAKPPTAKITSPAAQKKADAMLGTVSKLLGSIPVMGVVAGVAMGAAALIGPMGIAAGSILLATAAIPVRSTGTSRAGGGGAKGGLHPLKYLAGLALEGLISQYEHEKARDAYYSKWILGKVFTSARELGLPTSLEDIVPYIRRLANEVGEAYQQIPADLRQRWKVNSENYMEKEKEKEKVKESYNFNEYGKTIIWGTTILSKEGVSGQKAAAASIAYKDEQIRINSESDHVDINQKQLEAAFEGYDYLTGRKINILEAISIISTGIIINLQGIRNANRNIGITSKPFNISKVKKPITGKVTPPKPIEPPKIEVTVKDTKVIKGYDVTPKYSSYEDRLKRTPVNKGKWEGERGESKFVSEKPEVKQYLDEAGVDGVNYKSAMPNFLPFSKGEVKILNMTSDRRKNFAKADELLAREWSTPEKKWTADDVADWREDNKYTWHELNDLESMHLVPSKINGTYTHLGGVGEHNIKEKLGE